ncbi:MAG: F0F1 ATP synthase subunit B [Bacteroidales bacterium]|nr:F0F1 ATP synthase subunit B [Bacteroidales bacterium]
MNLITPDSGLLFWMVLIFGIVFFILAKWGFPAITGMVDERNKHIDESLRLAEEAQVRMSKLAEEQAELIAQTRQEQGRILKEAARARSEILAQAKADAQAQTAEMVEKAREQIANERETALRDIRRQVALLSVDVAEKVLRAKLDASPEQQALIDRLTDEAVIPNEAKESITS